MMRDAAAFGSPSFPSDFSSRPRWCATSVVSAAAQTTKRECHSKVLLRHSRGHSLPHTRSPSTDQVAALPALVSSYPRTSDAGVTWSRTVLALRSATAPEHLALNRQDHCFGR